MPRPKKPVKLLVLEGRTHLTKKQIAERMQSEISIGDYNFKASNIIKKDPVALKKWNEIVKLFTEPEPLGLISTSDSGLMERYCLTYAEYIEMRKSKYIDHKELNKKLDLLLKMEKELLLTPASKIRSSGKNQQKQKQSPLERAGYGHV